MEDDLMEDVEEAMEEVGKKEEVASARKRGASGRGNKGSKSKDAETSKRGKTSAPLPKEVVEGRGRRERIAASVKEASEPPTTEEEEIPPPVQVDEPAQAPAAALPQEEEEEEEEALEAPMAAPNVLPAQVLPAEVRVSESLASTDRASASPPCEVTSIFILITHLYHPQSLHPHPQFSPNLKPQS